MIDRIMSAAINGLASLVLVGMAGIYSTYSDWKLVIASIVFAVFFAVRMVRDIKVYKKEVKINVNI